MCASRAQTEQPCGATPDKSGDPNRSTRQLKQASNVGAGAAITSRRSCVRALKMRPVAVWALALLARCHPAGAVQPLTVAAKAAFAHRHVQHQLHSALVFISRAQCSTINPTINYKDPEMGRRCFFPHGPGS